MPADRVRRGGARLLVALPPVLLGVVLAATPAYAPDASSAPDSAPTATATAVDVTVLPAAPPAPQPPPQVAAVTPLDPPATAAAAPTPPPRPLQDRFPRGEGEPVRLEVTALGIAAPVHPVAVDEAGRLGVPADPQQVGWWADGALLPGTPTVMVGHVDSRKGPGVFADLDRLRVGHEVVVALADGARASYAVTALRQVSKAAFPTEDVYGSRAEPTLQLITCAGAFDRRTRHYRDNLVVTAVLSPPSEEPPGG